MSLYLPKPNPPIYICLQATPTNHNLWPHPPVTVHRLLSQAKHTQESICSFVATKLRQCCSEGVDVRNNFSLVHSKLQLSVQEVENFPPEQKQLSFIFLSGG